MDEFIRIKVLEDENKRLKEGNEYLQLSLDKRIERERNINVQAYKAIEAIRQIKSAIERFEMDLSTSENKKNNAPIGDLNNPIDMEF